MDVEDVVEVEVQVQVDGWTRWTDKMDGQDGSVGQSVRIVDGNDLMD